MTIEQDLFSRLTAHAGLSALLSTRLYPLLAPQDATLPYATYQRISSPVLHTFARGAPATQARFQFDVYAASALSAQQVATQLRTALIAMTGDTVTVHEVLIASSHSDYERETALFRESVDALVIYGGT